MLPSVLYSADLISPAACCRDTHRNRWLQSNMFPFQGCNQWLRRARAVRHSEVTNNRELRNCDVLIYLQNQEGIPGPGLRMWR